MLTSASQFSLVRRRRPVPLRAQHNRERPGELARIQRVLGLIVGADDPNLPLLQPTQRAREIRHLNQRHRLGGARGSLCARRPIGPPRDPSARSQPSRRPHRQFANTRRDCEDPARRPAPAASGGVAARSEQVIERAFTQHADATNLQTDALMAFLAGQSIQLLAIAQLRLDPFRLRQLQQLR